MRVCSAAPRDAAAIRGLIDTYIPEPYLTRARNLLSVMSDADVAAFYERAARDTDKFVGGLRDTLDLAIYACQESFPFNSRAGFEAELQNLRFAFLADSTRAGTEPLYTLCESFDPVPHPGFNERSRRMCLSWPWRG